METLFRKRLDPREMMKYKDWVPVTDENRFLVESEGSIGHMKATFHEEDDGTMNEYARFTPIGYRFAKRDYISDCTRIRRFLYSMFPDLGDAIFVGDIR